MIVPHFAARKEKQWLHLGEFVALTVLQGGMGLPIFCRRLVAFLLDVSPESLQREDVPDVLDTLLQYHVTVLPNTELRHFIQGACIERQGGGSGGGLLPSGYCKML